MVEYVDLLEINQKRNEVKTFVLSIPIWSMYFVQYALCTAVCSPMNLINSSFISLAGQMPVKGSLEFRDKTIFLIHYILTVESGYQN